MARTKPPTPEDLAFIGAFTRALNEKYEGWNGTEADFAAKLDVSRPGLKRYLNGEIMPGVRTVVLAKVNLGIAVRYGAFDTGQISSRAKRNNKSPEAQLLLPFAIGALKQENVEVELSEKKPNRISLNVRIRFAS